MAICCQTSEKPWLYVMIVYLQFEMVVSPTETMVEIFCDNWRHFGLRLAAYVQSLKKLVQPTPVFLEWQCPGGDFTVVCLIAT